MAMHKTGDNRVYYSAPVAGATGNHRKSAQYDIQNGYLGITQWLGRSREKVGPFDRVLLTPRQVRTLLNFLGVPSKP